MFEKDDKRRIYWLIDQYLSNKLNGWDFCNEYYYSYDLELDHDILTESEKQTFSLLSPVIDRFSCFEEDHKQYPGAFFTKEELKQKVIETKELLKDCWPTSY